LDVSGYGTLDERLEEGHDISDEEQELMQRALDENSVIVAQMTPFYETVHYPLTSCASVIASKLASCGWA
jgi:hypothetical protein